MVDGFLFSLQAEGKALRTIEYYTKLLRHFLNYVKVKGWNDSCSIDSQHVREFLAWTASRTYEHYAGNSTRLLRKGTPTSAWPYFRALRRLFNWAVVEGFIELSPLAKTHFKTPSAPAVEPFTQDELKRLLAVCELDIHSRARFTGLRNKAMLLLFLDSGLRRAEMVNLKMKDLNLDTRQAMVVGKGNKIGIVPFCPKTAKSIWFYLQERHNRTVCDSVWVTEEGKAFSVDGVDSWFERLKQRPGVTSPDVFINFAIRVLSNI